MAKKSVIQKLARLIDETGKIELQDIRLVESSSKLGTLRNDDLPEKARQYVNFTVNLDGAKMVARIVAKMGLDAVYEPPEAEPAIAIRATFEIHCGITKSYSSNDALAEAIKRTGVVVVWPFWREFVHSMTIRMGLPPFPVPLVKFDELMMNDSKKAKKADKQKGAK